ncbi:hypothetical protein NRIC_34870 [Enterococcus florum]|uniref:Uncharacterized protein n=1 Tax=Enterococcus florum TaxID=2480627 RepID=A0A4P5PCM8_9ENTE|nr:hypothetical protein NRIC_34870 [Enterococcus florum]
MYSFEKVYRLCAGNIVFVYEKSKESFKKPNHLFMMIGFFAIKWTIKAPY